jgi:RNA polymerase sigma factor (sigma-70 family)
MEAASIKTNSESFAKQGVASPLLRLQSDDRLVALTRRGNQAAFEVLVARYQSKLLSFCRHMLGNREDAEDVLQEVFAAAYTAMLADDREIMVKPWLYRICRNRSLNHMRKAKPVGVDSMDIHVSSHGLTTADQANRRADFRDLMDDIALLPETQRTALMLREMDGMPYEEIAAAMETTVPSVKSLLVRARVALAEMSESRGLTCDEVRIELGEVAEGLTPRLTPPVKRHLKSCERCKEFKAQLTAQDVALAAFAPVGALLAAKQWVVAQIGIGGSQAPSGSAAAGSSIASSSASVSSIAGTISAGASTVASKAAAGIAAAAIVTAQVAPVGVSAVKGNEAAVSHAAPAAVAATAAKPADKVAVAAAAPTATAPTVTTVDPATVVDATSAPAPDATTAAAADSTATVTTTDTTSLPVDITDSTTATTPSENGTGANGPVAAGASADAGSAGEASAQPAAVPNS